MAVSGKGYGDKTPCAFSKDLGNQKTDSHIPFAPATTANLTQIKTRKDLFQFARPSLPTGSSFHWKRLWPSTPYKRGPARLGARNTSTNALITVSISSTGMVI
jgi:hypothetical protein